MSNTRGTPLSYTADSILRCGLQIADSSIQYTLGACYTPLKIGKKIGYIEALVCQWSTTGLNPGNLADTALPSQRKLSLAIDYYQPTELHEVIRANWMPRTQ